VHGFFWLGWRLASSRKLRFQICVWRDDDPFPNFPAPKDFPAFRVALAIAGIETLGSIADQFRPQHVF
jgi:hypothetical protein